MVTERMNIVPEAIEQVLESLDAGGEQSQEFADEIKLLRQALAAARIDADLLADALVLLSQAEVQGSGGWRFRDELRSFLKRAANERSASRSEKGDTA